MQRLKQCVRSHLTISNIGIGFSVISIISAIVTIVYFSVALSRLNEYSYIYDYKKQSCGPTSGFAYEFTCDDKQKWISMFNDSSNRIIIENPFSVRNTRVEAINDRGRIDMGFNYTCYCRSYNNLLGNKVRGIQIQGCSIWGDCIIDSDFVDYIQRDNSIYYVTFVSFLASSVVTVVFSIVSIIITIHEVKAKIINSALYTELK